MSRTAVIMFQSNCFEDEFWIELRELRIRAREKGWNVVQLDAHLIDLQAVMDKMEADGKVRLKAILED